MTFLGESGWASHREMHDSVFHITGDICRASASPSLASALHVPLSQGQGPFSAADWWAKRVDDTMTKQSAGQAAGNAAATPDIIPDIEKALARVQGFQLVGLTDEYDLTVCLFHAMLGGECLPAEFINMRPGGVDKL